MRSNPPIEAWALALAGPWTAALACTPAVQCPEPPPRAPHTEPAPTSPGAAAPSERWVPAGPFLRGCGGPTCPPDETPERQISTAGFWIDAGLVTVSEYQQCVKAGKCSSEGVGAWGRPEDPRESAACRFGSAGDGAAPMTCVDWSQAAAYCSFVGKELPTEARWEKAARALGSARGPGATPGQVPVSDLDAARAQLFTAGPESVVAPVESFWEWTLDAYDATYYARAPEDDPSGPTEGPRRAARGARVFDVSDVRAPEGEPRRLRLSTRAGLDPLARSIDLGFRCVRTAPAGAPSGAGRAPASSPRDDVFLLGLGHLAGRCDTAPAWVSAGGGEAALCTSDLATTPGARGGATLYFYDPSADHLTEVQPVSMPLDLVLDRVRSFLTTFEPLVSYSTSEDAGHPARKTLVERPLEARGEGLVVRYRDPVLTVTDEKGRELVRQKTGWQASAEDTGCHTSRFDGALSAVRGSRKHGVFLITLLSVNGVETCGSTSHFVRLPAVASR